MQEIGRYPSRDKEWSVNLVICLKAQHHHPQWLHWNTLKRIKHSTGSQSLKGKSDQSSNNQRPQLYMKRLKWCCFCSYINPKNRGGWFRWISFSLQNSDFQVAIYFFSGEGKQVARWLGRTSVDSNASLSPRNWNLVLKTSLKRYPIPFIHICTSKMLSNTHLWNFTSCFWCKAWIQP